MDVNNCLYYQIREGVEPDSVEDGRIRNAHRMLHVRKQAIKTRYPNKLKSMRRRVRGNKNYKLNHTPKQADNWNVPIYMPDFKFPFSRR